MATGSAPCDRHRQVPSHLRVARRFALALGASATVSALSAMPAKATPGEVITRYAGIGSYAAPMQGPATNSGLVFPEGVAVDSRGNVYIADTGNSVVEKVTPDGTLSIFAGNGKEEPPTPGPATHSGLSQPADVAVDSSGNVYIADTGNNVVEKVTPAGILSVMAGDGEEAAAKAGPALASPLHDPIGLAIDPSGDVYIGDTKNNRVEKVTPTGTLSFFAGNGSFGAPTQGPAAQSRLAFPQGLAIDSQGNLYIADIDNARVEKVTPGGTLSFFAGNGSQGAPAQGPATGSPLNHPSRVAVDANGDVFIADTVNYRVEEVTSAGTLSFVAGTGASAPPTYGSSPLLSPVYYPLGIAVSATGVLYIADGSNSTIDRVGPEAASAPAIIAASGGETTATISFLSPETWGTSPITGYQMSLDGGLTWQPISTTGGPEGTLQAVLVGLSAGSRYTFLIRALNASGPGLPGAPGEFRTVSVPTTTPAASSSSAPPAECVSRRVLTIHWKLPRHVTAGGFTVTVDGRTVATLSAGARQVTVNLAGRLGGGVARIRVQTRASDGRILATTRVLHTCRAKLPGRIPSLTL